MRKKKCAYNVYTLVDWLGWSGGREGVGDDKTRRKIATFISRGMYTPSVWVHINVCVYTRYRALIYVYIFRPFVPPEGFGERSDGPTEGKRLHLSEIWNMSSSGKLGIQTVDQMSVPTRPVPETRISRFASFRVFSHIARSPPKVFYASSRFPNVTASRSVLLCYYYFYYFLLQTSSMYYYYFFCVCALPGYSSFSSGTICRFATECLPESTIIYQGSSVLLF